MANPEFGIVVGGEITLWMLEIDLNGQKPTQLTRGEIKVKTLVPEAEELYKVFSEQFLNTPGIHFSSLKSGVGSYLEVRYVLEQMSGGIWEFSERHAPPERGEVNLPQGVML